MLCMPGVAAAAWGVLADRARRRPSAGGTIVLSRRAEVFLIER